ncbi:Uncharacterised protein family UPF0058 [Halogranum rubrum]|uniref:Uncharacterized protein family UPF0058 n=1 Tax=Halogranum rubrum TaxID=553466 RepID=A0A1I4FEM6_9EURY|nr:Uncharacterised protein family UPF0058 [Halogranum rubrum]
MCITVKKNELVHLHTLLAQIAEEYITSGVATPTDFDPYAELGISPMALRESRDRHEEAVRLLARILADCSKRATETVPVR